MTRIERDNLTTAENFPELRKNKEASESQPSLGNKNTKTHHNESEEQQIEGKKIHEIGHR